MSQICKPHLVSIPLADGLRWQPSPDWCFQEKLDGVWHERDFGKSVLVGELVRGLFTAFDIPIFQGQDIRKATLRVRLPLALHRAHLCGSP